MIRGLYADEVELVDASGFLTDAARVALQRRSPGTPDPANVARNVTRLDPRDAVLSGMTGEAVASTAFLAGVAWAWEMERRRLEAADARAEAEDLGDYGDYGAGESRTEAARIAAAAAIAALDTTNATSEMRHLQRVACGWLALQFAPLLAHAQRGESPG